MSDNDTPNFDDRPEGEDDKDTSALKYQDRSEIRDHDRKFWALKALLAGFFLSVIIDITLILCGKELWVSRIFSTTIVPILAFILGMDYKNKSN